MFFELIATIVAGFACAGIAMLLNVLTGRRLPRFVTPVAAGLGMLATTISNEYTWYDRTTATLPQGLEIASTVEEKSWFRPWTQAVPFTKRFVAVDTGTMRRNPALPDQRLVELYFFGRWSTVKQAPMLYDCPARRSALLIDGAEFASDGRIVDADWRRVPEGDPIIALVCRGT
ncbi:MAG: hypothetical protein QNJ84_11220 [Alphaproteobacteria bacterium]|nr:hypothetical protein [Alphaproteobacteria bacterium]